MLSHSPASSSSPSPSSLSSRQSVTAECLSAIHSLPPSQHHAASCDHGGGTSSSATASRSGSLLQLSTNTDADVLRSALIAGAEQLLSLTSNESTQPRWVAKGSKHNVNLYVLPQDTASDAATVVPAFLGVGVVHCPPVAVLELLSASERKCEYDEIFESALTVHRYDEVTAVERHTYWTPSRLIVAARDLCLLGHAAMLADGALILFARSVQFDEGDGAVRSGYTRAQLDIGGFILQPLTSAADRRSVPQLDAVGAYESAVAALLAAPACRLTFVARCDLRGSLATPLRTKLCKRQPLMIQHIDRILSTSRERTHRNSQPQLYEEKLRTLPVYRHLTARHTLDM